MRGVRPVPARQPGAKVLSPRATAVAKRSATWVAVAPRPGQSPRVLGGCARGCQLRLGAAPAGLRGAPGWLVFLPPFPHPYSTHLSEAGRVSEAGSGQSPRCRPERGQGQSALCTSAPSLLGNWQSPERICCRWGTGAWGQEDCVPSRMASVPVPPPLWNPCACPIRKTRKGNLYVTSMREEHRVGEDHGIEKHSQKIIFHLNFLSLTKFPGLVPKGGVKTERTARHGQCNLRHKQTSLFTVPQAKLLALLPPTPI